MNQLHTEVLTNEISLNTFKIYLEHPTINTNEYIKNITREFSSMEHYIMCVKVINFFIKTFIRFFLIDNNKKYAQLRKDKSQ